MRTVGTLSDNAGARLSFCHSERSEETMFDEVHLNTPSLCQQIPHFVRNDRQSAAVASLLYNKAVIARFALDKDKQRTE